MKVSSRATVIVGKWQIEPNEIKELPETWGSVPAFGRLLSQGFLWPVDDVGQKLPWDDSLLPKVIPKPVAEKKEQAPAERPSTDAWAMADDYLGRNPRTVLKALTVDKLSRSQLTALQDVESKKPRPRPQIVALIKKLLR